MPRFSSWLAIALAAAFLVVASVAFSASTTASLAFAIAIGTLVVSVGIAYTYRAHAATTMMAVATAILSAWTIVASLVFSVQTAQTLALAEALGLCGLAVLGLAVHELTVERVVHAVKDGSEVRDSRLAAAA